MMSSSAVSLSHANAVGVAIGGASDITGNAGTIIVGSYRTVRASASDGTRIRIGRYAHPYRTARAFVSADTRRQQSSPRC